jgi:hypothetical protein
MKLQLDSGLWTTAPHADPIPLVATVEVSGAVLSWTVDTDAPPQLAFIDPRRAEWLWRVVGEAGHVALSGAIGDPPADADRIDLDDVDIAPGALDLLRRLAVGHWLRRWWPTSVRDAIAPLEGALLDAEVAVITAEAQHFFTDDTIDSDVGALLAPHAVAFARLIRSGDHRIVDVVRRAIELADDAGAGEGPDADVWQGLYAMFDAPDLEVRAGEGHHDDYALAAGDIRGPVVTAIARGRVTINWAAVPPRIFDAAENTAEWAIPAGPDRLTAVVRTALVDGDASGITVTLRSGTIAGAAELDDRGSAAISLRSGADAPSESDLWAHDWSSTELVVGVPVAESVTTRERARAFVRGRLAAPPADAFLAEILAAESDY